MQQPASPADIKSLGTILAVWAHPDDESMCAGGLLATAVDNGQTVICVTATKGELGIRDAKRWPPEHLGDIRAKELAAALQILGIKQQHWLGYRDADCANVPTEEAVGKIKKFIQQYQPDTIVTFGPDGLTGHSDHQTVSKWVDQATKGTNIAVYQVALLSEMYEKMAPIAKRFNWFFKSPLVFEAEDCDIYYELPPGLLDKKYQCLCAMPSQYDEIIQAFSQEEFCNPLCKEGFRRAKSADL